MTSTSAVNPLVLAGSFSEDEQKAIADYIGVPASDPAFLPMLGIARHLDLSPILGEIWLVESQRFDRESADWVDCLRPAVGRDGFLKHARSHENFKAIRSGVVCANDFFETEDDGEKVKITHKTKLEGLLKDQEKQASKDEASYRGPIFGAWAKLFYKDDTPPFYYYAPLAEHGKKLSVGQDGAEPQEDWAGAWTYTSALISKCAQSYVLRIGIGISGVVPVDEILGSTDSALLPGSRTRVLNANSDSESIVKGLKLTKETKEALLAALGKVNELSPFSWPVAKVSVILEGASEADAKSTLAQIEKEIESLDQPARG